MHMHKPLEVMFTYIDISCFSLLVPMSQPRNPMSPQPTPCPHLTSTATTYKP